MNQQTQHRIEPGYYKARAIRGTEQYAHADNGNEQIAIDFEVPALGRNLTVFFHFTDAATKYAVEKLRACGWRGDDVTQLEGIDANEVELQVRFEPWQGRMRMKVDVAAGGGGRPQLENQMDERAKRALAARVKQLVGGRRAPAPAAQRQGSGGSARRQARRRAVVAGGPASSRTMRSRSDNRLTPPQRRLDHISM
jgi:hypothetical protein